MAYDDNNTDNNRLEELGGSDYEMVDGQPNIKGWEVKNAQGEVIGDVEELLFNPASRKVRYMIVDTDANDLHLNARKVLIPIGLAELHENDDDVIVPNVTADQLNALPDYDGSQMTADTERSIVSTFEGYGVAGYAAGAYTNTPDDDFYKHEQFNHNRLYNRRLPAADTTVPADSINTNDEVPVSTNNLANFAPGTEYVDANYADKTLPVIEENLHVGKQEVETGATRITTSMVEKPVEETVNLREEHVHVEHTPVDRPLNTNEFDTFKEGQIELTEHKEIPVVNKEARVIEEVNISKNVDEREETIRDTVRNTEVHTERIDPDKDRNDPLV
jgi:stress response protein YsnF